MKIIPVGNKIQIEIEKPKAGKLDMSSKETAVENGTIIAVGEEVKGFKVGQKILVKAWCLDVISFNGINYYFLDSDSQGICAIVK